MLRNVGQRERGVYETFGYNSRLDTLQAAICSVKLDHLETWTERRRAICCAVRYRASRIEWTSSPARA